MMDIHRLLICVLSTFQSRAFFQFFFFLKLCFPIYIFPLWPAKLTRTVLDSHVNYASPSPASSPLKYWSLMLSIVLNCFGSDRSSKSPNLGSPCDRPCTLCNRALRMALKEFLQHSKESGCWKICGLKV